MTQLPVHNLLKPSQASPEAGNSRRDFVRGSVLLAAGGVGCAALPGCGGGGGVMTPVSFSHGVASGDPLSDRIMLWTRVLPQDAADTSDVALRWEIASDAEFKSVANSGTATASAANDYTVKVDATGLKPGQAYWYRFSSNGQTSAVGRSKTLPGDGVAQVKLAVFSCANYPTGYFNVYAEAAKRQDVDAAVFLGDYIYEYGRGGYASSQAKSLGREVLPAGETIALADYRQRYAQYRADADLQALHAAMPMIAVWDDHEVANDSWRDGAENHQPATEGDYALRKSLAQRVYHEWMPIRPQASQTLIYRSFSFGKLLDLHMLDTRLLARDQQLDYANYTSASGFNAAKFGSDMAQATRQLLGTTQTAWLQGQLASATATWQVLGQQVLMGRMNIPAPILFGASNPAAGVSVSRYIEIVTKARNAPTTLTATEQAVLAQPSIPYNLDAWDGYTVARETVLATARQLGKNLVVLSGDTHNAWASDLLDMAGNQVGVEFATSSVTSPGFEEYLPKENPQVLAAALTELIGPLQYCDTSRRGYLLLSATASECRADWVFVNTISSRNYTASVDKSLKTLPGAGQRKLVAV